MKIVKIMMKIISLWRWVFKILLKNKKDKNKTEKSIIIKMMKKSYKRSKKLRLNSIIKNSKSLKKNKPICIKINNSQQNKNLF